jgi:large subunit ribosomal protein L32
MGAVPKRKISSHRRGNRRSHHHIKPLPLARCPQCRELKPTHRACPNCGTYRGMQILPDRTAPR